MHAGIQATFGGLQYLEAGLRSFSAKPEEFVGIEITFSMSTGYMTECSLYHISSASYPGAQHPGGEVTATPANPPANMVSKAVKLGGKAS